MSFIVQANQPVGYYISCRCGATSMSRRFTSYEETEKTYWQDAAPCPWCGLVDCIPAHRPLDIEAPYATFSADEGVALLRALGYAQEDIHDLGARRFLDDINLSLAYAAAVPRLLRNVSRFEGERRERAEKRLVDSKGREEELRLLLPIARYAVKHLYTISMG